MIKYYAVLAVSIWFNVCSLLLMKKGAVAGGDLFNNLGSPSAWIKLMLSGYMIGAVGCFGASFVTWMIALKKIDLSLAYPLVSVSYIIIALASQYMFDESIGVYRWLGMGLIIAGVVVMFQK